MFARFEVGRGRRRGAWAEAEAGRDLLEDRGSRSLGRPKGARCRRRGHRGGMPSTNSLTMQGASFQVAMRRVRATFGWQDRHGRGGTRPPGARSSRSTLTATSCRSVS